MAVAARKRQEPHSQPRLKTFHVTLQMTRIEEWCVDR